jgi:hypothetical protein
VSYRSITPSEKAFLQEAAKFLENPSVLTRIANKLGQPIEFLQHQLPDKVKGAIRTATDKSLRKALEIAVETIPQTGPSMEFAESQQAAEEGNRWHTLGTVVTGTVGGFFGLVALPLELPVTTTLMLRSIAQNADHFGADLRDPRTQLECLYVFTLGTPSKLDDALETSYYASRLGFSEILQQATRYVAAHSVQEILRGLDKGTAPILLRLLAKIAAQFEIAVSEKVLSGALPIIGAAGGAAINAAFTHYFNEAAKFHFGIRKLEKECGEDVVRRLYTSFKS